MTIKTAQPSISSCVPHIRFPNGNRFIYCTTRGNDLYFAPHGADILHHMGKYYLFAPHGATIRMVETESDTVARTPDEPSEEQVLAVMELCVPYTVGELTEHFDDASRWTIQRRLDDLVDAETVEKKKHSANRVSYWIRD